MNPRRLRTPALAALLLVGAVGCGSAAAARPVAGARSPVPPRPSASSAPATAAAIAPTRSAPPGATTTGACPATLPPDTRCVADGSGNVALVRLTGAYAVAPVAGDLPPTRGTVYREVGLEVVGVAGAFYYAPARFSMVDAGGTAYRGCLPPKTHPAGPPLGSGLLKAGQRAQGSVDYDVPAGGGTLRLEDGSGRAVATWPLPA